MIHTTLLCQCTHITVYLFYAVDYVQHFSDLFEHPISISDVDFKNRLAKLSQENVIQNCVVKLCYDLGNDYTDFIEEIGDAGAVRYFAGRHMVARFYISYFIQYFRPKLLVLVISDVIWATNQYLTYTSI